MTLQVSNCALQHANFEITHFTDSIGLGIQNAFLLHVGTNTIMSTYIMNLYKDEDDMNQSAQLKWLKL